MGLILRFYLKTVAFIETDCGLIRHSHFELDLFKSILPKVSQGPVQELLAQPFSSMGRRDAHTRDEGCRFFGIIRVHRDKSDKIFFTPKLDPLGSVMKLFRVLGNGNSGAQAWSKIRITLQQMRLELLQAGGVISLNKTARHTSTAAPKPSFPNWFPL